MTKSDKQIFTPVNDPVKPYSQVLSCIEIQGFNDLVKEGQTSTIQVFYERIAQEIYNSRKKNYSWGFKVIEPEFLNLSDRIYLSSRIYTDSDMADLNSGVFKLFIEFNNIILSTALHMHIPVKGIIRIGEVYKGTVTSRKPALVSGKEPLILNDLLKVFSFGEIFPHGFSSGMIPAVEMPYHFGENLTQMQEDLDQLEAVGIFMPLEYRKVTATEVTILQWILLAVSGVLIGMSKTGLSGVGLMVVPLLANAFGGRPSVGLLLPILIFADVFAVSWYNRHAQWKHILRLLPYAFLGILLATVVGKNISDSTFNYLLAALVIVGIMILVWRDIRSKKLKIPESKWFAASLGSLGGFATMIGNAAGPVMALYLLSMRLPKNIYIGTGAWFFFIINLSKVPLHIWSWKTITPESFILDLFMIPAIAAGAFLGIWVVKLLTERIFRIIVIVTTLLSALLLF